MRIIKTAVLAFVLLVTGTATAQAQEVPIEGEAPDVECYLNNDTDPSLSAGDSEYAVNTPLHFVTQITDPGNRVAKVTVYASQGNKGGIADEGWNKSFTWTQSTPGDWLLAAVIQDVDGNVITPTGDCDVIITFAAVETTPEPAPTTPTTETPTPTTVHETTPTTLPVEILDGPNIVFNPVNPPAPARELARTGVNDETLRSLCLTSLVLITLGGLLNISSRRKRSA